MAMTDESGVIAENYSYDAYGKVTTYGADGGVLNSSNLALNSYTYTGRRIDKETGLMYFRARYYSPELGHFISRDPLAFVDGMNLYAGYFAMYGVIDPMGFNNCDKLKAKIENIKKALLQQQKLSSDILEHISDEDKNSFSKWANSAYSKMSSVNLGATVGGTASSLVQASKIGSELITTSKRTIAVQSKGGIVSEAVFFRTKTASQLTPLRKNLAKVNSGLNKLGVAGVAFDGIAATAQFSKGDWEDGIRSTASAGIGGYVLAAGTLPVSLTAAGGQYLADKILDNKQKSLDEENEKIWGQTADMNKKAVNSLKNTLDALTKQYSADCDCECEK